jgi:dipeptidyl aminopeptidase/acylaminoacyl peptidase
MGRYGQQFTTVTHLNADVHLPLPKTMNIEWVSDGLRIQGWLLHPANYDTTKRFKAVVAGAGAADWLSYYGQNSIDKWMMPYFGASPYDDPAAYAKSSAMTSIKQTKTPALILVGERDGEAPAPQSFQFWHALKELNIPTQLVVYPNEGHSFYKPEDLIDVTFRTVAWFNKYMPVK